MIDFSLLPRRNKTYAGANGSKIAVMYEDELYMLKFPGVARKNKDMSYANGCICEYLGCHIFEIAGIPLGVCPGAFRFRCSFMVSKLR